MFAIIARAADGYTMAFGPFNNREAAEKYLGEAERAINHTYDDYSVAVTELREPSGA